VLDLLLCDEGDGERVGNPLAHPDEKGAVRVDPGQDVLCLLPAPAAVEPRLENGGSRGFKNGR